jgi:hypothetical protein
VRPWLKSFAPILISFSLRLVSDHSLIASGVPSVPNAGLLARAFATRRACRHIAGMADGYIVEVTSPFAAAGEPVRQIWYAHIHDK